jgi:hypothetical protein
MPEQVPASHRSAIEHGSPSPHGVPSSSFELTHCPVAGSHAPFTHGLDGHTTAAPIPMHVPDWHASFGVHASPSSQGVPSGLLGLTHIPVAGSHAPASLQAPGGHSTGAPVMHTPASQLSPWVHRSPSSHGAPFARAHVPFAGAPAAIEQAWHGSPHAVSQQAPSTQKPLLQWLASLQPVPSEPSV